MLIVAGSIRIQAGRRDEFVVASQPAVAAARKTPGCLDFAVTADPSDVNRVVVYERWDTAEQLLAFRGGGPSEDLSGLIVSSDVAQYAVLASPGA